MSDFNYELPVNLLFGAGRVKEAGEVIARYGKKVLIVTGRSSTKKTGLLDKVINLAQKQGLSYEVFDKVTQNPLTTTAIEGAAIARERGCDVVLGVGGGSIMDCAKAIAFLAVNDGDVNDYIFNRRTGEKALPIVLIPTTCGTGSEGNSFAVLTNPDNGDKKSLRCKAIYAKASIVDPECMMSMPKEILASVGFDALCHCMEAYLSRLSQPISEVLSLQGMQMIIENLFRAYEDEKDLKAFEALSLASTYGGMVIQLSGVILPHGMEHPASGLRDIVHGRGLSALTPVICDASYKAAEEKYLIVSRLFGGSSAAECGDVIRKFAERLKLPLTLSEQGIQKEDIPWMAENCMKVSAGNLNNHPREFAQEEIAGLYEKAL